MEIAREDCSSSSGCESGWTLYLQSSFSPSQRDNIGCDADHHTNFYHDHHHQLDHDHHQVDDEDLSMVSDASSGPPHFHHHDDDYQDNNNNNNNINVNNYGGKVKRKVNLKTDNLSLDDTASSTFFIFPSKKNNGGIRKVENQGTSLESSIDYASQGFSATHFQGISTNNKFQQGDYGFLRSPYSKDMYQQYNQW